MENIYRTEYFSVSHSLLYNKYIYDIASSAAVYAMSMTHHEMLRLDTEKLAYPTFKPLIVTVRHYHAFFI
jgi:hypothetical protein